MIDELLNNNNYFSDGTTSTDAEKKEKKEKIEKPLEKKIDSSMKFEKELYNRETSYCKVVGYVKEQDN